ncbi:MAG: hypothetical protein ACLUOF_08895 [Ruminococcus sp.]
MAGCAGAFHGGTDQLCIQAGQRRKQSEDHRIITDGAQRMPGSASQHGVAAGREKTGELVKAALGSGSTASQCPKG